MKTLKFIVFLFCVQFVSYSQATLKNDILLKTTGDELIGKVQEITDTDVKFSYANETLIYSIKKSEITKITFASGRVEVINPPKSGTLSESHHNKIAILPFNYLIDKQPAGNEMTYKVQDAVSSILNGHTGYMTIQSTETTNSLLAKAEITSENIHSFSMGEICNILDVEYVIYGLITQDLTSVSNTGGTNTQTQTSGSVTSAGKDASNGSRVNITTGTSDKSTYSSSSSTTTQNYSTDVTMKIYTDKGETIFSEEHKSFWGTNSAYKVTLNYLLKRTPIYKK